MAVRRAHTILVPTDFSQESMAALNVAIRVSCESGAEILLLHVLPTRWRDTDRVAHAIGALKDDNESAAKQRLRLLCRALQESGIAATPLLRHGEPAEEIVSAAGEGQADRIVLCLRSEEDDSNGLSRRIAERVMQRAPCEVWSIRGRPNGLRVRASVGNRIFRMAAC